MKYDCEIRNSIYSQQLTYVEKQRYHFINKALIVKKTQNYKSHTITVSPIILKVNLGHI